MLYLMLCVSGGPVHLSRDAGGLVHSQTLPEHASWSHSYKKLQDDITEQLMM